MKKKVGASRDLYSSHLEAVQNVVRLHKANSNACLEEVSALTTSSASSIDEVTPLSISFLFFWWAPIVTLLWITVSCFRRGDNVLVI